MSSRSTVLFRAVPAALNLDREEKRIIRRFAETARTEITGGRSFTCLITGDAELRRLNRDFLGHYYATDVLSFPQQSSFGELGDVAVSAERASAQAAALGHLRVDEIRVLMLHGLLHLMGFDHESDEGEMARAERKWRFALGLPTTLLARSVVSR